MEIPNEQNAHSTSNTLKQALQNEAYSKAYELMERLENERYRNGWYGTDNE